MASIQQSISGLAASGLSAALLYQKATKEAEEVRNQQIKSLTPSDVERTEKTPPSEVKRTKEGKVDRRTRIGRTAAENFERLLEVENKQQLATVSGEMTLKWLEKLQKKGGTN